MSITAASFCPHPPLLIPQLAAGAAVELDRLRAACLSSLRSVLVDCDEVLVIGTGGAPRRFSRPAVGTLEGYGLGGFSVAFGGAAGAAEDFGPPLPLSLTIAAWLLRSAGWAGPERAVIVAGECAGAPEADLPGHPDEDGRTALLVMGDGAPNRSLQAPGYLDERAEPYDSVVAAALGSGDPARLAALDVDLARDLGVAGWPAWRAAARLLADARWDATVRYDAAPYGVGYLVADWHRAP